jgi:hypothetical protein
MTFSFTGTILVPDGTAGSTVSYHWQRSDGSASASATRTVPFAAGETAKTVSDMWTLGAEQGTGATYADQVQVSTPNVWYSTLGAFAYTCQLQVQSITASASSPTFEVCVRPGRLSWSATLSVSPSPGGVVTYYWVRDTNNLARQTVMIPPGATTTTVTDIWSWDYPEPSPGDHYEQMVVTAPNSIASNQAHSTGTCSN